PIFRLKYLKKELEKRKSNPELLENYRTVTVTYLMPSYKLINNYISHFRYSYKSVNLNSIQASINQVSIRPQAFTITHFKRLLLNFIISNNISFYARNTSNILKNTY
ncbi:hypothetical protein DL95DRAFT_398712, partial [Leptodontidium sp. 2 PMI_412]